MLLPTLPRGQSIVSKGRLPVERNILLGLAVTTSSVFNEKEDCSQNTTGVGYNESDSKTTDVDTACLEVMRKRDC